MGGACNAVIANMSPDIEANKKDQHQEYDNLEAAEVGSKLLKMGPQDGT
jgi:hypothetical protein